MTMTDTQAEYEDLNAGSDKHQRRMALAAVMGTVAIALGAYSFGAGGGPLAAVGIVAGFFAVGIGLWGLVFE